VQPLFIEICAGHVATSLALAGRPPPAARQGSKRAFADAILRRFGLQRGEGADFDYLWVDADLGVQNYLTALSDAEFREQVLLELEPFSWHDPMDDLRPLYRQQRALGVFTEVSPSECARYLFLLQGAFNKRGPFASEGRINASSWLKQHRVELASASTAVNAGAHTAKLLTEQTPIPRASIAAEIKLLDLGGRRVYTYIDPPYVKTTKYLHELSRAQVVETALHYAQFGPVVVSEGKPVEELIQLGWTAENIFEEGVGRRRGMSINREGLAEWITMFNPSEEQP
jgi:hypothetical protein